MKILRIRDTQDPEGCKLVVRYTLEMEILELVISSIPVFLAGVLLSAT
jgi:hypothetical protein